MLQHILKKIGYIKEPVIDARAQNKQSGSSFINVDSETIFAKTLDDWKIAVMLATDPENPDKSQLLQLYKNMDLDLHLTSVIDSRIAYCQRSPFKIVNEKGDENNDLTWLLERTWFEDFIKLTLNSRFKGITLIELFDTDPISQELLFVEEIPMSHFNSTKGIILKNSGDNKGLAYKEGALTPFYIEVGKPRDLGLYKDMAPMVFAKKLGIGSWLDYIDKYGVPPLFATTDREDDAYLNKLAEMAANFRANGWMVGRGNDKFEVGDVETGKPEMFDALIERANSEISKKILGGSGLADDKSFVGSTEIQFRLAKDRFESDKLLVKNVINQQLFPRLMKISGAYQVLEGHYFEWDDTEVQTKEDVRNMITTLAPYFDLDPEEIEQKTGLKILGQKSNGLTPEDYTEDVKKKS